MTDQVQHGQVIGGVAVGGAPRQVQSLARGERLDGRRLRRAVQQSTYQTAGVLAVHRLGNGAECAGQAQAAGDDAGQLDGGGGHQPDPLARLEVALGEFAGTFPDPVGHGLVVDLLAQGDDVGHLVPGHEGERGFPGGIDVTGVLRAPDPEVDLLPGHLRENAGAEHLAGRQPTREVVDRCTTHQGVVYVEERAGRGIRDRGGLVHRCRGGRRRAGQRRPAADANSTDPRPARHANGRQAQRPSGAARRPPSGPVSATVP